jgi:hypothetical protein
METTTLETNKKVTIDVGDSIVIECTLPSEYVMDFEVFKLIGRYDNNDPVFKKAEGGGLTEPAESLEDRAVFMKGEIKWDGCSNYEFPESQDCMLHVCRNPAKDFAAIWDTLYKQAAIMLADKWNGGWNE